MTVRRALSTTAVTVIFVAHGNRRGESKAGLKVLDISVSRQTYLGLPDGRLWAHQAEITEHIVTTILSNDIGEVMTLGRHGYDEHPDHITTHLAAESAIRVLRRQFGRAVGLSALSQNHSGNHVTAVYGDTRQRKLGALAAHQSQFPIHPADPEASGNKVTMDGYAIDGDFWESFGLYHPLVLHAETYDRVL